ncbi:MAG TPA: DUF1223 domain-containing protein [Caulobacteraceae bacterium]|jgi:hypothetical protein|nr:DUF1223 domain-containing protein [Caulobacteraceae bacterium]
MRKAALAFILGVSLAAGAGAAFALPPVVVELFTSQGCSSCVNSGQLIAALDQRSRVLTLTFPVGYWDYLGWRDTLAMPAFDDRQHAYMRAFALRDVYTPQVVVNGRLQAAAVDRAAVEKLVKTAVHSPADPPRLALSKARLSVGAGEAPAGGADVWLIRYLPGDQSVRVLAGENRGKTIVEHNVVRELSRLGGWRGRPVRFHLPAPGDSGLKTVVIVQGVRSGRILAVSRSS